MKTLSFRLFGILITSVLIIAALSSCKKDSDESSVNITVNEGPYGDIGGDFTGKGGSGSRTINWQNNLATADYNADRTSSSSGMFEMTVADANGKEVLNRSLNGNKEPDSFSGVTDSGEPGNWTVTITLTSFNGDGSYSLSAGD